MNVRWGVGLLLLALGADGLAQSTAGIDPDEARIGVLLWHESPNDLTALDGIRRAFVSAGRKPELLIRKANSDVDAVTRILDEFRLLEVDLIFAMGTQAALLARDRIDDIPIVFTAVTNPVETGVVEGWGGSKRNIAGNSNWIGPETILPVFRLAVPQLKRLGMLRSRASGLVSAAELRAARAYLAGEEAPAITIVEEVVDGPEGIPAAVDRLLASNIEAVWIPIDFTIYENLDPVRERCDPRGVPLVSSSLKGAQAGAVAGVLVDYELLGQRAVVIALDILEEGRAPGEIEIGTMRGFQVIVNLAAARRCQYELPLALLVLADQILEDDTTSRDGR